MNLLNTTWADWFLYSEKEPMFFTSIMFWVFFVFFLGGYSLVFSKMRARNVYLLLISLFFYFKINGLYFLLLLFSCLFNYQVGLMMERSQKRKAILLGAVSFNLLFLGFYKYAVFITESLNQWLSTNFRAINWLTYIQNETIGTHDDIFMIALPIGISFYTFQAISYLVDVYKQRVSPVRNFYDFSFYLSFFPQLVSGPIVRASNFIPQLYQEYKLTRQEFSHSLYLILKGLLKKMLLADFLALHLIDRIFDAPMSYSGAENLLALYGYAIQIYCDFSGYTDIAIGLALLLGFKIPVNFNSPYQATSLTDFWHRWHISLSLWLRDYLYIPLGGNRKGKFRMHLSLIVTMLLGGLWHGANWRFVIWGAIHGVALSVEKLFRQFISAGKHLTGFVQGVAIFITFQFVCFAWIFFRLESFEKINAFFYQIKTHFWPHNSLTDWSVYSHVLVLFATGLVLIWTPFRIKEKIRGSFIASPVIIQMTIAIFILLLISQVSQHAMQPFIYFRF